MRRALRRLEVEESQREIGWSGGGVCERRKGRVEAVDEVR
jgi:hypothetical protein